MTRALPTNAGTQRLLTRRTGLGRLLPITALVLGAHLVTGCGQSKSGSTGLACDTGEVTCGGPCTTTLDCPIGTHCNTAGVCDAECIIGDDRCGDGQTCGSAGLCSGSSDSLGLPTEQTTFDQPHDGGVQTLTPGDKTEIEQAACAGITEELESIPAVIEFVIDTSYSMAERQEGQSTTWSLQGSGQTKWDITHTALRDALDGLGASVSVGMLFYPNHGLVNRTYTEPQDISVCFDPSSAIPVAQLGAAGSAQRDLLTGGLDAVRPNGNTPTHDAYLYALNNGLRQSPSGLSGPRYMLLLTDGVPTFAQYCVGTGQESPPPVPTDPIVEAIAQAYADDGTKTFVIGAPGSQDGVDGADARPWLSAAARAGQTAAADCSDSGPNFCHMDMTESQDFAASLRAGLGTVTSQLGDCTYAQPVPAAGQVIDADSMVVILTIGNQSVLVMPDNTGDCTEGWQLIEGKIRLCSATCEQAKADPTTVVEVVAGCDQASIQEVLK